MPCSSPPHADLQPPEEGLVLRPMRVSDVDQILQIEKSSFATPWQSQHFLHEIRENRWAVNLDVERRRGVGRWLLLCVLGDAIARGCRSATLEVRPSNEAALALYRVHGFVEIGRRKGYYAAEGEDAIVMQLDLDRRSWKTIASAGGPGV